MISRGQHHEDGTLLCVEYSSRVPTLLVNLGHELVSRALAQFDLLLNTFSHVEAMHIFNRWLFQMLHDYRTHLLLSIIREVLVWVRPKSWHRIPTAGSNLFRMTRACWVRYWALVHLKLSSSRWVFYFSHSVSRHFYCDHAAWIHGSTLWNWN
jgi:hypothetical protein